MDKVQGPGTTPGLGQVEERSLWQRLQKEAWEAEPNCRPDSSLPTFPGRFSSLKPQLSTHQDILSCSGHAL